MVSRFRKRIARRGTAASRLATAWLALALGGSAAFAQAQPAAPAVRASAQGVPDQLTVLRMVYSSMSALDHANQTGNYSVLRDLGAPSFQANNNSAALGTIFQSLRSLNVDLSYALILSPNFDFPPAIVQGGLLRVRGSFPFRPQAIGFDFLFQNVAGQWRLFGIAVAPIPVQQQQSPPPRR